MAECSVPVKRGSAELQVLIFNLPQNPRSSLMFSRYKGLGREELLDELFTALSEGPEIPSSKLQRVAELTGSSRLRSKSLTKSQFLEILGDDVQTSTEELRRVLLTVRGDVQLSSKPWSRRSFAQAWRSSDVANMDRRSMISAIFTVLDHAKSRTLQSDAIRAYAEQTGFEGTVVEWEEQFAAICHHFGWTQGAGISQSQFNELVEDDDDTDDDELRQALLNLQMQSMRSGRPSLLRSSWQRKSLPHLQGLDVAQTLTRPELISKIFSLLDTAGQTKLFSAQFKKFADLSGFEGDAAEWSSQFAAMCEHFGWNASDGVSETQFMEFVGDEVENSDDELRRMLVSLQARHGQSSRHSVAKASGSRRSLIWADGGKMDRPSMIQAIFTILDAKKRGTLQSDSIRTYAEQTGFEGTDADWEEQFAAICQHFGWTESDGITSSQFRDFVQEDDETDDDELRQALLNLQMQGRPSGRASVESVVGSSWQRKSSLVHVAGGLDVSSMDRRSMISAIFTVLDHAKSGTLQSDAVRAYAEQTGFEGADAEWKEQFAAICHHFGWTQGAGISQSQFGELIEDDDETDDDELRQALLNLRMQATPSGRSSVGSSWQRKSLLHLHGLDAAQTLTRPELISKIFSLLDTAGQTKLFSAQFKKFADLSGFEGDAAEWSSQFAAMCEHFGWNASDGVSETQFMEFVGDEVENSDDELRQVLVSLQS